MTTELIHQRKAALEKFAAESHPVILDFAERIGHPNPTVILDDNLEMSYFLGIVHEFLKEEPVDEETHIWISVRMGYVLGEYLIQKYKGYWGVNENPESAQYGRIVVFAISPTNEQKSYPIDVFETATFYINQEPERDLVSLIDQIETILK